MNLLKILSELIANWRSRREAKARRIASEREWADIESKAIEHYERLASAGWDRYNTRPDEAVAQIKPPEEGEYLVIGADDDSYELQPIEHNVYRMGPLCRWCGVTQQEINRYGNFPCPSRPAGAGEEW